MFAKINKRLYLYSMIVPLLAIATVSYLLAQRRKKKKPSLEERFHVALEHRIDKLLGNNKRNQQLQELSTETSQVVSKQAKRDNRNLAITAIHASSTLLIGVFAPVYLILSIPVTLFLSREPFYRA